MTSFSQFLDSLGIVPAAALVPGKWVRCSTASHPRKRNGSCKIDESGDFGFAIDHASMAEASVWKRVVDNTIPTKEREAERQAALAQRLALRRQEEIRGTMRAETGYAKAQPLMRGEHAYLQRKRLSMEGARGLKVDADGWLVIPMYRDGKLISIQRVSPDGQKLFAPGAPTKGGSWKIWRPAAPVTILVEGAATGMAIFAACPMAVVEVCFSAANLVAVASRNHYGTVAVAGDNDPWSMCHRHKKENCLEPMDPELPRPEWCRCNPGKTAAMEAARILGCGYAVPSCADPGTDFHDLFLERLTKLEKANEGKPFAASPFKLRSEALAPIRAQIMRVAKNNRQNV